MNDDRGAMNEIQDADACASVFAHPSSFILHRLRRSPAFTLVELLVVILIILSLTAITIPTVLPAIEKRRVREAARQVNTFIAAARNRAIEKGRPFGVMIERFPGLPEASLSISYAQTPQIYTGGFQTSGAQVNPVSMEYHLVGIFQDLGTGGNDSSWNGLVAPGDLVRFNYSGPWFRIDATNVDQLYTEMEGQQRKGRFEILDSSTNTWRLQIPLGAPPPRTGVRMPFEIMRSPTRATAGTMQLPEGVIIDLNSSGDRLLSFFPREEMMPANPLYSFYGVADPETLTTPGLLPFAAGEDPVIIMFAADGSLDRVYTRRYNATTMTWTWAADRPVSPIYLLVGQRERVPFTVTATAAEQLKNNWRDLNSVWIKIEPQTGTVVTAENLPPTMPREAQPWANPTNPGGLDDARLAATEGTAAGGR